MRNYIYIFTLVIMAAASACHPYDRAIPEKYIATWTNNGAIELGLYEEVAIYKNQFYDYESVSKNGDNLELSLRNGHGTESISVTLSNNKQELQVSGKGSISTLKKNGYEYDPSKAETDTSTFCEYKDVPDSATVLLYLRRNYKGLGEYLNNIHEYRDEATNLKYRNYNECSDNYVSKVSKDDHFGFRYEYKVPVHCVTENFNIDGYQWSSYSSELTRYLMEPGDTLVIVEDGRFSFVGGSNSRINTEMGQYGRFIWGNKAGQASIASATTHGYHDIVDSLPKMKQIDLEKFKDFCTQNGANISNKFKQYITHEIEYLNAIRVFNNSNLKDSIISNFKIDESTVYTNSAEWEFSTAIIEQAYRKKLNVEDLPKFYFADTELMSSKGLSDIFVDRFVYRGLFQLMVQKELEASDKKAVSEIIAAIKNEQIKKNAEKILNDLDE